MSILYNVKINKIAYLKCFYLNLLFFYILKCLFQNSINKN